MTLLARRGPGAALSALMSAGLLTALVGGFATRSASRSNRAPTPIAVSTSNAVQQDQEPAARHPTATRTAKPAPAPTHARLVSAATRATPTYLVLFVLDGGRPDYLNTPDTPNLQALIKHGTQYSNAFAGILESETPSGHAALGSGTDPSSDGILSFSWANSDNVPVTIFSQDLVQKGALENILRANRVPSIAAEVHHADPSAKVVSLSGHKYYAADAMGGADADVIEYYTGTTDSRFIPIGQPGHMPPAGLLSEADLSSPTSHLPLGAEDHLTMRLAMRTFERMHQRVTLINLPEFDWPLGHVDGGDLDPAGVKTLMQGFDKDLGALENLYRRSGILDHTVFAVTADHGFTVLKHTVSRDVLRKAVTDAGTSVIQDAYSTGAYLWVKDSTRAAQAAENIARLQNPYIQAVYFRTHGPRGWEYVRASGADLFRAGAMEQANQYLLKTFNGPNAPDIVVTFAEDAGSEPDGQASWKGDHGGVSWESQHIPLVLSGFGVTRGQISAQPARLIDIAPTVLELLHAPTTGMQGIPLADAIASPNQPALARERSVGAILQPVTQALKLESAADQAAGR